MRIVYAVYTYTHIYVYVYVSNIHRVRKSKYGGRDEECGKKQRYGNGANVLRTEKYEITLRAPVWAEIVQFFQLKQMI